MTMTAVIMFHQLSDDSILRVIQVEINSKDMHPF